MTLQYCDKCGLRKLSNISPTGNQCLCGLPPKSEPPRLSEALYTFSQTHAEQIASVGKAEQIGELCAWISDIEKPAEAGLSRIA